jgi:Contractile injection system tape measure protein
MTHVINRLQFEMNCPDEDQAFGMRHNFAQTLQPQITAVIEKLCTQYVSGDEWIQIDKIEIDMGQLSPNVFSNDFEKIFLYKFEKELLAKLSGIPAEQRSNSNHQSMFSLLKHFLKKGILPWWADEDTVNLEAVCNDVFEHSEKLIMQFFLQQANNTAVWQRAAFQLGNNAQKHIVQMLKPLAAAKEVLDKMMAALTEGVSALPGEQKVTALKKLQWQADNTDELIIGNAPAIFAAGENQLQVKKTGADAVLRLFAAAPGEFELVKNVLNRILGGIQPGLAVHSKSKDYSDDTKPAAINNEAEDYGSGFKDTTELIKLIPEVMDNEEEDEPGVEKLLVKGAGIILLAPFLNPFFTKLQLLEANQWVSRQAQVKAVYLLKYLGNGPQFYQEYQLVLEKLLCGIPIHQPLEPAPEFTQAETDEAEELLHSVLEHWQRLKNTSVNGLRESFFKRDGIVTPKESNWQLQVERKTMDVLLDSIPWGFSTISLPWNEYIIFTEW